MSARTEDSSPSGAGAHVFRIGLSRRSIGDLKRNDAQAAFRIWARAILSEKTIANEAEALILDTPEALRAAAIDPSFDGLATSTTEMLELGLQPESLFFTVRNGRYAQPYVLLVPQGSAVQTVADLAGQEILIPASPKMELVRHWLGILMSDGNPADPLAVSYAQVPTASKAVLRVFFRQAAASVVTAPALELAIELNPQISKQVRVISVSPDVVTGVFFLTHRVPAPLRAALERTIATLHETPAGRQVLTVFQADRMEKHDLNALASTKALLEQARSNGIPERAPIPEGNTR
ncbi:MAG: PhnD/SsuA/transferrin family substrate-binding protein [Verrucomicrobiales bacterium]|nr:PhnD/SsuA/transferrin family substrate-binding protein [Verrucomicrobiales bacterium]